jgi:hypothetical protein
VTQLRRGPLGAVRDGAFLAVIAVIGLALAGSILAVDRAVDAGLPHVTVVAGPEGLSPASVAVAAGHWTVLELRNEDTAVREWMVLGVPNLSVVARPGQTARLRFVLDRPGTYEVMGSVVGGSTAPGADPAMGGTLVVAP